MEKNELKPCPFCKKSDLVTVYDNSNRVIQRHPIFGELRAAKPDRFWTVCQRCGLAFYGVEAGGFQSMEAAITAWNAHTSDNH